SPLEKYFKLSPELSEALRSALELSPLMGEITEFVEKEVMCIEFASNTVEVGFVAFLDCRFMRADKTGKELSGQTTPLYSSKMMRRPRKCVIFASDLMSICSPMQTTMTKVAWFESMSVPDSWKFATDHQLQITVIVWVTFLNRKFSLNE
ncbi:unnamed protein product, partial [Rhizoctonia solani]